MYSPLLHRIILQREPEVLGSNVMIQHRIYQGFFFTALPHDPFLIMSGDPRGLQIHMVTNGLAKLCWCLF